MVLSVCVRLNGVSKCLGLLGQFEASSVRLSATSVVACESALAVLASMGIVGAALRGTPCQFIGAPFPMMGYRRGTVGAVCNVLSPVKIRMIVKTF